MATKERSHRLFLKQMNQLARHFRTQDVDFSRMIETPACLFVNQFARRFLQYDTFDINDLPHCSAADTSIRGAAVLEIIRQFQRPDFNFLSPTKIFEFLEKVALSALQGDEQSLACMMLALQVYSKFLTGGSRYLEAQEASILISIILKYWGQSGHYGRISIADLFWQEHNLEVTPSPHATYIVENESFLREVPAPPVFTTASLFQDDGTLKSPLCYLPGLAFVNPEIRYYEAVLLARTMHAAQTRQLGNYLRPTNFRNEHTRNLYNQARADYRALDAAIYGQLMFSDLFTLMLTGHRNLHWVFKRVPMNDLSLVDRAVIQRLHNLEPEETEFLHIRLQYDPSNQTFDSDRFGFKADDEIPYPGAPVQPIMPMEQAPAPVQPIVPMEQPRFIIRIEEEHMVEENGFADAANVPEDGEVDE